MLAPQISALLIAIVVLYEDDKIFCALALVVRRLSSPNSRDVRKARSNSASTKCPRPTRITSEVVDYTTGSTRTSPIPTWGLLIQLGVVRKAPLYSQSRIVRTKRSARTEGATQRRLLFSPCSHLLPSVISFGLVVALTCTKCSFRVVSFAPIPRTKPVRRCFPSLFSPSLCCFASFARHHRPFLPVCWMEPSYHFFCYFGNPEM